MSTARRHVLKALFIVLLLFGTLFLYSCQVGDLFGGGGGLSSSVPVDDPKRANPGQPRDNTPYVMATEQPGTLVAGNRNTAILDYSNASDGYISAQSFLTAKTVALVDAPDGARYQFTIASNGSYTTIPLTVGNGTYHVGVYENLSGNEYVGLFSVSVRVELEDELAPFLYSNPYVNFADGDDAVRLSESVAENSTSDVETVEQIYLFIVQTISYDYDKAATVAPGYLPNNSNTLRTKDGICFDFASLAAAMLRAQRLPTKLDIGYCGDAYHAWIEVYTKEQGWIRKKIEFPGEAFVRMDPTFDSASKGKGDISKIIGDGKNYRPMFYY